MKFLRSNWFSVFVLLYLVVATFVVYFKSVLWNWMNLLFLFAQYNNKSTAKKNIFFATPFCVKLTI